MEKVTVADFAFQKKIDLQIWHLGRAFEYNFVPGGAGIWTNQTSKVNMPGSLPVGGMLKLRIDGRIGGRTDSLSKIIIS